jgi:hypothetical protein
MFVRYMQSIIPTTTHDAPLKYLAKRAQDKEEWGVFVQEWWKNTNKSEVAGGTPEPEHFSFENREYES